MKIECGDNNIKFSHDESNRYIFDFNDDEVNSVLNQFDITTFRRFLPHSKREELRKYFVIETNNNQEFVNRVRNCRSNTISSIEFYSKPKNLFEPNDYDFTIHIGNDGLRDLGLSYLDLIRAKDAWDLTRGNPNVIIGVHENYVDSAHEDLSGKISAIYGYNNPSSYQFYHGTLTSGVLAANTNNDLGISAIGYDCRIAKGFSRDDLLSMASDGIKIINISRDWGDSTLLDKGIIEELYEDYGVTIIAAAGNDDTTKYIYPAFYEEVISVTSIGHEFDIGTTFSGQQFNWKDCHKFYINPTKPETTHTHNDKVDICAPGYYILTTEDENHWSDNRKYGFSNGTSIASPIVAGIVGLMYSIDPYITNSEVKQMLKSTAVDIYNIQQNQEYFGLLGAGRVDAYEAVKQAGTLNLTGSQSGNKSAGYAFILEDVFIPQSSDLQLYTKSHVIIEGSFEMQLGSTLEILTNQNVVNSE